MKILHVIPRFNSGGTATWLNQLALGETFSQDQVYLAFGPCGSNESEEIVSDGYRVCRIASLRRSINPLLDIRALFSLCLLIRRINPDILNTHTFKAGILARLASKLVGKNSMQVVHTIHGHLKYGYFSPSISRLITFLERVLERITDGFIVAGNRLLLELEEENLLKSSFYEVILPGFDSDQIGRSKRSESAVQIGWIGRLTKIKRPDRVLEVARLIPEYSFLIAGSGELEGSLRKEMPSNVRLLGWVDPVTFWQGISAGLLTSDNEATPYAIIEANMAGIPFVATDVGSVSDVLLDGENGFLSEGDPKQLASKLKKLIEDESTLERFSQNAFEISREKFAVKRFQTEHRNFYLKLLK